MENFYASGLPVHGRTLLETKVHQCFRQPPQAGRVVAATQRLLGPRFGGQGLTNRGHQCIRLVGLRLQPICHIGVAGRRPEWLHNTTLISVLNLATPWPKRRCTEQPTQVASQLMGVDPRRTPQKLYGHRYAPACTGLTCAWLTWSKAMHTSAHTLPLSMGVRISEANGYVTVTGVCRAWLLDACEPCV